MRNSPIACLALLFLVLPAAAQYQTALPGYRYEFPRDHFNHEEYQTEWWYFTGNATAEDGHRFGFELTFFRQGVNRDAKNSSAWTVEDIYLAHLALSDLSGGRFYQAERTNRAGPGIAGIDQTAAKIWNGNWSVTSNGEQQTLQAVDDRFQLSLVLRSLKPPVIHGENGVSPKAPGLGRASHYISLTRLDTRGTIDLGGTKYQVQGLSWMDHEFFTHPLEQNQAGWDWLGIQLSDKTEIMLYRIRRKDGSVDPYSSGTFVDSSGTTTHIERTEFTMEPLGGLWKSPASGATYPIAWKIAIPKLDIELEAHTPLESQELSGPLRITPTYWEGAIDVNGHRGRASIRGLGYLEMTGYDRPVELGPSGAPANR